MAQLAPLRPLSTAEPQAVPSPAITRARLAPPLWREFLLLAVCYAAYALIRVLVPQSKGTAFANAADLLSFERSLGFDVELGLNQALLNAPWLAKVANLFYVTAHFAVTLAVLVWLYRRRPEYYRWMRSSLLTATGIALIGFWLYPLAPPRFLTGEGFVDPVVALNTIGLYSSPEAGSMTNQYAAMPSMHAGWALWCAIALVLLARRQWVKVAAAIYPVITVLVILATANHYVLDAVVGVAVTAGALALTRVRFRAPDHNVSKATDIPAVPRPRI